MQKVYVTLSLSLYFLRRLPSLEVGPILPLLFFPHSPLLLSLVRPAAATSAMADHATRKTTTDRLEEAINRLSNSQATLLDKHADLFDK